MLIGFFFFLIKKAELRVGRRYVESPEGLERVPKCTKSTGEDESIRIHPIGFRIGAANAIGVSRTMPAIQCDYNRFQPKSSSEISSKTASVKDANDALFTQLLREKLEHLRLEAIQISEPSGAVGQSNLNDDKTVKAEAAESTNLRIGSASSVSSCSSTSSSSSASKSTSSPTASSTSSTLFSNDKRLISEEEQPSKSLAHFSASSTSFTFDHDPAEHTLPTKSKQSQSLFREPLIVSFNKRSEMMNSRNTEKRVKEQINKSESLNGVLGTIRIGKPLECSEMISAVCTQLIKRRDGEATGIKKEDALFSILG
ncbi:unnamed protein product [Protopolystoma xenopodis]|uniref:Uncharacterized protein n=1 Tax=Protopolystoma xenopodis TaxID=117903 RepID=A0A3S5FGQ8_9PLAT|nr:unnamed protein product [Protopolystoma xenopodis]